VEKDYIIKEVSLETLVKDVIKKNARALIEGKFNIELNDLAYHVFTDTKWVDFILGQIIANCIKYKKEPAKISIYAREGPNHISLYMEDQGIGILEKDIPKVFDKGFTGQNGRKYLQSTGIGLYLCKKLCDKLGLHISLESTVNEGVTVEIIFPKNSMLIFES
jgi:signal transduction histidine kinase